jgi:hypothetical protein
VKKIAAATIIPVPRNRGKQGDLFLPFCTIGRPRFFVGANLYITFLSDANYPSSMLSEVTTAKAAGIV